MRGVPPGRRSERPDDIEDQPGEHQDGSGPDVPRRQSPPASRSQRPFHGPSMVAFPRDQGRRPGASGAREVPRFQAAAVGPLGSPFGSFDSPTIPSYRIYTRKMSVDQHAWKDSKLATRCLEGLGLGGSDLGRSRSAPMWRARERRAATMPGPWGPSTVSVLTVVLTLNSAATSAPKSGKVASPDRKTPSWNECAPRPPVVTSKLPVPASL